MSILKSLWFFVLIVGLASGELAAVDEEDNIFVLNNTNFDQVINAHKYLLVKFCK